MENVYGIVASVVNYEACDSCYDEDTGCNCNESCNCDSCMD